MGIKKFITTFTIIMMVFLVVSGFILITYINNQEVKAIEKANSQTNNDVQSNTDNPSENNFATSYINYPEAFNFIIFVKDVDGTNTDAMMIVNYDPQNKKISTLSIPRDIVYKTIYAKDDEGNFIYENGKQKVIKVKINSLYIPEIFKATEEAFKDTSLSIDEAKTIGKTEGSKNAVHIFENFFNVNIKYYVTIDLSIFREVIDQLGGVDFYIPANLHYDDPTQDLHIHFNKGTYHLNGEAAEELLRYRKPNGNEYNAELDAAYPTEGSDLDRINMQQKFFQELIKQKSNFFYVTKISNILDSVYTNIQTNIDLNAILDLVKYIPDFDMESILWETVPGEISGNDYVVDYNKTRAMILENFKGSNK